MPKLPADPTAPAAEYPLRPYAMKMLAARDLTAELDRNAPDHVANIVDADGDVVVRVRRAIHPLDLVTLLDFGRRRYADGMLAGEDRVAAQFRALLEPRGRV